MSIGIIIAIVIVVLIVLWAISAYNGLVALRNRVKNAWSQIDVQLKQRADLIPNLVETVKGYASHESEVFTQVTQAPRQGGPDRSRPQCRARRTYPGRKRAIPRHLQPAGHRRGIPAAAGQPELPRPARPAQGA